MANIKMSKDRDLDLSFRDDLSSKRMIINLSLLLTGRTNMTKKEPRQSIRRTLNDRWLHNFTDLQSAMLRWRRRSEKSWFLQSFDLLRRSYGELSRPVWAHMLTDPWRHSKLKRLWFSFSAKLMGLSKGMRRIERTCCNHGRELNCRRRWWKNCRRYFNIKMRVALSFQSHKVPQ